MTIEKLIQLISEMSASIRRTVSSADIEKRNDSLYVDRSRNGLQYYRASRKDGSKSYIPRHEEKTLRRLAQNTYEKKLLHVANKELSILERCVLLLNRCPDVNLVYDELPEDLQSLVSRDAPDDRLAMEWQNRNYVRMSKMPDSEFITSKGEHVRSKTEWIIAERLYKAGVPYFYEVIVPIGEDRILSPDFYILNKRTGKVFIWEHLGKMDDENYRIKNLKKIDDYAKIGFVLGKNLIVTFESGDKQISTKTVERIIQELFL